MKIDYSAPGKLFISGEWAILDVGNYGLVAAVNNRVHVSIETSDSISITAGEFDIHDAKAEYSDGKLVILADEKSKQTLKLLGEACATAMKFLEEYKVALKPFKIETNSSDTQFETPAGRKKVGFGSSAAIVVATIAAVIDFHDFKVPRETIYKLSTIAHFYAQGKVGSAFDVAASTYGGLFVYSRFDPEWLTKRISAGTNLSKIVKEQWPSLVIQPLDIPDDFRLLVGWTGDSASTTAMIKQMEEFKTKQKDEYDELTGAISRTAYDAIEAFKADERERFLGLLEKNETLLRSLGEASGMPIETPALRKLSEIACDYSAAGKLSGAGGGDCGIAVCFDEITANNVAAAWEDEGLIPLEVTIDREGVRKD